MPLTLDLPDTFRADVSLNTDDTDGELDIVIESLDSSALALPDGVPVTIAFQAGRSTQTNEATIGFSCNTFASFRTTSGTTVEGSTQAGSVLIEVVVARITLQSKHTCHTSRW